MAIYSRWYPYQRLYLPWRRKRQVTAYVFAIKNHGKPLFIHINRTAGTSIASALNVPQQHYTLAQFETLYEDVVKAPLPTTTIIVSAVRNPFGKVLSDYRYRKQTNQTNIVSANLDFNDWVVEVFERKNKDFRDREIMFLPQTKWLHSEQEYTIRIIRFENLIEDFENVQKQFGGTSLPWKKRTQSQAYRNIYNNRSKQIIESVFEEDLNRFNYTF
ncbi:sulfotransferase family 2 domain-containing protein [Luteirhabdus pelagi]|uniref:sulfotransferase family 2 domain-containing protein n=1 Tax=Luteirhabdus pelagi TaxID=2792783 RepID=UPI00193A1D68|nr:sulfotransferase family 2 domain-containing protein [Luteirhabdus pelagi]